MHYIKQEHKYGCGIACVAMATGKSYKEILKLVPIEITDFNKKGIAPESIQSILNELGYRNELRYRTILHSQNKRDDLRYNFADILIFQKGNHFLMSVCDWIYDSALTFTDSYSVMDISENEIISVVGVWDKPKEA